MSDLITNARARVNLPTANPTPASADDTAINTLITACSAQIERYCRRTFVSTAYDELYSGTAGRILMVRNFPIISVQSVRFRPTSVMQIRNNSPAVNQKARVWVDSTNVNWQVVASGISSTTTAALATYPTLGAMAAQINSVGGPSGWQAVVAPGYELWPSTDLVPPIQGAQNAAGVFCDLKMHAEELTGFQIDPLRGYLMRSIVSTDPDFVLPYDPIWPRGLLNFRVQYTAGFATVPADVQEACAQMVAIYFQMDARQIAPRVVSRYTVPSPVAMLLMPWRSRTVSSFGA
jgi:hypothetical protein